MVVDKDNICEYAGGKNSPWTRPDKRPTLGPNQLLLEEEVFTTPTSDGTKCTVIYCDGFNKGQEKQVECQGTFGTESNRQKVDFNFTTSDGYRTYCQADNQMEYVPSKGKEELVTHIECGQPIPIDEIPKK